MSFKTSVRTPNLAPLKSQHREILRSHRRAAVEVTDMASKRAQRRTQAKIRSVGLGKLANAVGQTSTKKKRRANSSDDPFGAIFARGGDLSRGGSALDSYAYGTVIRPLKSDWLWIPTKDAPKFIRVGGRRRRLTPGLWKQAGLNTRIGKLHKVVLSSTRAILIVRKVSLSPKGGPARALGKRKPRTRIVPDRPVVVFVGIRITARAKKFDHRAIVRLEANRMPNYLRRVLRDLNRGPR